MYHLCFCYGDCYGASLAIEGENTVSKTTKKINENLHYSSKNRQKANMAFSKNFSKS